MLVYGYGHKGLFHHTRAPFISMESRGKGKRIEDTDEKKYSAC